MAKEKQTRRMIAMALAAAVTVTAVPADALAASDYSSKVSRMQERNAARKAALDQKLHREPIELVVEIPAEAPVEAIAETPADPVENAMQNTPLQSEEILNQDMVDVTVQIPDTDVDDPATEDVENQNSETFGEVAGTETVAGNPPADANDKEYDFTVETTVQQGQVTIETTEMLVKENVAAGDTDMDYISSEETPSATNDLLKEVPSAAPEDVSDLIADAEDDAYEYIYAGTGNTSQLRPAVVFTEPMTDEEKLARWGDHAYIGKSYSELWVGHLEDPDIAARDENGKLILVDGFVVDKDGNRILKEEFSVVGPDGKKYYTQRIDNPGEGIFVEGWYSDGEWHAELNAPADTDENGNPVLKKVQLLNQDGTPVLDENNAPIFVEVGKMNEFANKYENGVIVHSGGYGKVLKDQDGNVMVNYLAVWASTQQFVLVDKTTGEVITTYCVDISTATQDSFGYNVENLEDADYYNEEQAEKIRSIALKGYWGTLGYETDADGNTLTDADGNPIPKKGSLEAMKKMLKESGEFTEEELDSLTDGVALSATQMAIWTFSNKMAGAEFVNTHYFGTPDQLETNSGGAGGNVPADKEDEAKLLMKLYTYLKNLEGTSYEGEETTVNTIINKDNFAENLSVTVLHKTENHENNADDDDTNDAYTTNVSFALVVTPSTENGDDLVVKVIDGSGNTLASGRVAGENGEGESYDTIVPDADGNYTFKNIVMIEGEQNFNITMEGIQNLKEGVYLYSSEVRMDGEEEVSSQTMVGIAEGKHKVDVSLNLKFELDVDDQLVVKERFRKSKSIESGSIDDEEDSDEEVNIPDENPPLDEKPDTPDEGEDLADIPDEDVPMADAPDEGVEIADEEVPLADAEDSIVAETGDSNHMAAGFGGMLIALAGLFGLRRKEN